MVACLRATIRLQLTMVAVAVVVAAAPGAAEAEFPKLPVATGKRCQIRAINTGSSLSAKARTIPPEILAAKVRNWRELPVVEDDVSA